MSKRLRAGQQQHIKRQQAPDGTPYAPRKTRRSKSACAIWRCSQRTARYLKAKGTGEAAVVEFVGRVQRMANVHHCGLRDRPTPHSEAVKYEARPLLGFSKSDLKDIENLIIELLM